MKVCFKCGDEKPLSDFYRHKAMKDGHLNKCKDCVKRDVRLHRRENDSVREYDRRRYREDLRRRQISGENSAKWKKRHPERYKAHYLVSNAIRDGRLVRGCCEGCGTAENVHAHHDDYSKPLDVRWLCAKCHHRHHAEKRMADGGKV